ncbi:MAG: hypothetical protein EOP52_13130 [Sphingobacteriales bacterium]|nr:MAG: hypothetical protein EOP52_13130 [Sphingobacteriales bacterium]
MQIDLTKIKVAEKSSNEPDKLTLEESRSIEESATEVTEAKGLLGVVGGALVGIAILPVLWTTILGGAVGYGITKLFEEDK